MNISTPLRIEAFDNSHTHGVEPVSAMISFVDGRPNRKDYRKYKTKTAQPMMIMVQCVKSLDDAILEY